MRAPSGDQNPAGAEPGNPVEQRPFEEFTGDFAGFVKAREGDGFRIRSLPLKEHKSVNVKACGGRMREF